MWSVLLLQKWISFVSYIIPEQDQLGQNMQIEQKEIYVLRGQCPLSIQAGQITKKRNLCFAWSMPGHEEGH